MQRKQDGLVPAAEVLSGLDGPVQALRKTPPPAQRAFTRFDQVNLLVRASEADPDRGFMARMMALCSLPRSNPGQRKEYVRKNGPFTLVMFAGANQKLPFGNLPRLLMAWISTEAVQTQSRELVLGDSLSEFMRALGIYSNSRVHIRLRNQMERLFQCHVQLVHEHEHGKRFVSSQIADQGEFWWNERRPDEQERRERAQAARLSMAKGTASTRRRPAESWSSRSSRLWRNSNES